MKKILLLACLFLLVGCASPFGTYVKDRGNDFADCFKGDIGVGFGVDAQVMATDYIGTGAGLAVAANKIGFRGRHVGDWSDFHGGIGIVDYGAFGSSMHPFESKNPPPFSSQVRSVCGVNTVPFDSSMQDPEKPFLNTFDIEAGGMALFVGSRVGFSPGQLIDFIIGWTGIDIAWDDTESTKKESDKKAKIKKLAKLSAKEAVPELMKLLDDENRSVRYASANAILAFKDREAIPGLRKILRQCERVDIISSAVRAIKSFGAKEAAPELIELLKNSDRHIRGDVAFMLGGLGIKDAIPEMIKLLNDSNKYVRRATIHGLVAMGDKEIIPELIKALNDNDDEVRGVAANALGNLGAKEAISKLMELFNYTDDYTLGGAAESLGKLGSKESIPELIKLLNNEYESVRGVAVSALGTLDAKEAIPEIIKLLKDKDQVVRGRAAVSLVELGKKQLIQKENIEDIRYVVTRSYNNQAIARARAALKELDIETEDGNKKR